MTFVDTLKQLWTPIAGTVGGAWLAYKYLLTRSDRRKTAAQKRKDAADALVDKAVDVVQAKADANMQARIDLLEQQARTAELHAADIAKIATDSALKQEQEIGRLQAALDVSIASEREAWKRANQRRGN